MDTNHGWSKLCPDVLRKILESLKNPIDSHRAKTVCSNWYVVWKTCTNKPPCPCRIIHRGDSSTRGKGSTKLAELYGRSYCLASSGNWLLMVDRYLEFYISNFLTQERINLPSMESPIRGGQVRFESGRSSRWLYYSDFGTLVGPSRSDIVSYDSYHSDEWKNSLAALWINETTKDYVVAWTFIQHYLFVTKKGEDSWCNLNLNGKSLGLFDIAIENSKLYMLTTDLHIKIHDFSGDVHTRNPYLNQPFDFIEQEWEYIWKRKIAITKSGEVLIILSLKEVLYEERLLFYIFKMNLENGKWERVHSIGDEMLIFGHGVTLAPALKDYGDGTKNDSIYFVDDDVWPDHEDHDYRTSNCGVFDIATSRIEWPKKNCFSLNSNQWFVPGIGY